MHRLSVYVVAAVFAAAGSNPVLAGRGNCGDRGCSVPNCVDCGSAATCGPAAPPEMVERTIMVPQMTTETRTVCVTEYAREQREKTITVIERVPKQETVTRQITVMVPKQVTKTVSYQVCKPVFTEEEITYTQCVPHVVTKTGTRKVCKVMATQKTRTVTVDEGHWEDAPGSTCDACESSANCNSCCPRPRLFRRCSTGCEPTHCGANDCGSRVWVCKPVQKEVPYTCYERVWEDQPYSCQVVVMKPETKTRKVRKCNYTYETKTKNVTCTVCVPETQTKTCNVTRFECVPTKKTIRYTACVPHQVEKEVQVRVCKMVPKTIQVPACSVGSCDDGSCNVGGSCGPVARGRRCRGC